MLGDNVTKSATQIQRWENKHLSQKDVWRTQEGQSKKEEKQDCKQKKVTVAE